MEFASKNFKLIPYFGILPSNLKLDNILGFIPKHDNSTRAAGTFGLSKEEKASNMVYNWPAWARGIYTTNGTKLELSKYTYSSIEKGLYVAAYRICWFLRMGLKMARFAEKLNEQFKQKCQKLYQIRKPEIDEFGKKIKGQKTLTYVVVEPKKPQSIYYYIVNIFIFIPIAQEI
ncbi:hypothetical protein BLOT_004131 [Blomia tropicalis]|nr:hypothetical protein BLOT_004131 [Blomia tropicalis]